MTNAFLNKVAAERAVLSLVNKRASGERQLAGLSEAAIEQWIRKVGPDVASNQLTEILLRLSNTCQRLSDRSHETFGQLEQEVSKRFSEELAVLRIELGRPS